ncbi:MAG TPA: hypothetical protein VFF98_12460 [Novosphingobium sp.]|nr:hypothetical protein [Novosphingobium sp.]
MFFLALGVVLFGTLAPHPPHVPMDSMGDKFEHFTAFAGLALFARLGFRKMPNWLLLERLSFFGALIEVAQAAPAIHRDCDWHDWVADTMGAWVMLVAIILVRFWLNVRRPFGTV